MTWTPNWMGFGNVLYLWLEAWIEQANGVNRRVLEAPGMQKWIDTYPKLRSAGLSIAPSEVKFTSRRDTPWKSDRGRDAYTREQLETFIQEFLISAPLFADSVSGAGRGLDSPESLTVNVRRGDYYSVPEFERLFGFNQIEYLRSAITGSIKQNAATKRIFVVSDNIAWCKEHLHWLSDLVDEIEYADPGDGPQRNMLDVASSRRLVMTNSTFSYWCGYMSNVIYENNHAEIWAPKFFARFDGTDGMSKQLDPRWSIVDDITGGWDGPY